MTVLIIGAPDEAHAAFIHHKIQTRGHQATYFDTRLFPGQMRLNLRPDTESVGSLTDSGQSIPLAEIRSVYWRYHMGFAQPNIQDPFTLDMVHREVESTVGSLFRMLDCRWVNSPEAINMHIYKTYQLTLLHERGIRIPQTLVSNDPDAVRAFYEELNGQIIFKPVRGGAHTEKVQPEDLKPERLQELANSPVQFQEMIEGVDIRIYLVKDEVFAGEIRTSTLDFRADPHAQIVPVSLPDHVVQDCRKLADAFGLLYSGIDVRRTPEGEYVFLEGNPCPMFIHFEQQAGYPISDRLVDLLLEK